MRKLLDNLPELTAAVYVVGFLFIVALMVAK